MKVKLLVNFTCNRLRLKKDYIIENPELLSVMESKYSIEKLERQGIIEILEKDIIEEQVLPDNNEVTSLINIPIEEKKPKKIKKR